MNKRQFPVHPNLDQLKHQAKDLLHALKQGDPAALADFQEFHPHSENSKLVGAKLSDAQHVLAKAYGIASWPRLTQACRMTDALRRNDVGKIKALIRENPSLLHESARGIRDHWGPPLSYAANLGHSGLIEILLELGAVDIQQAFGRACLQGKIDVARLLLDRGAKIEPGIIMGACETQNAAGLKLLVELNAEWGNEPGDRMAPVALLLETYSRNPVGKHQCLELVEAQGISLPDTPVMALHRGSLDKLEIFFRRDPSFIHRRYSYREIYPLELGCHEDQSLGLHGTPLDGTTLLHMCVDFDEMEIARWLLQKGADVNARALIDGDGFGGHNALFNAVVSQACCVGRRQDDSFARLLLDHGARTDIRVSLRKRLRFVADESVHEFRGVTPMSYGQQFHEKRWVNRAVLRLLESFAGSA